MKHFTMVMVTGLLFITIPCFVYAGEFDQPLSISFETQNVGQALDTLARKTGIDILVDREMTAPVPKKQYNNQPVSGIVMDLMRGTSAAWVFSVAPDGSRAIRIYTVGASVAGQGVFPSKVRATRPSGITEKKLEAPAVSGIPSPPPPPAL